MGYPNFAFVNNVGIQYYIFILLVAHFVSRFENLHLLLNHSTMTTTGGDNDDDHDGIERRNSTQNRNDRVNS